MIKPEDLKKNNYAIPKYSNKNDEFVQLTAYDISQIEAGNYRFEPIPLNEQWSIDLGLKQWDNEKGVFDIWIGSINYSLDLNNNTACFGQGVDYSHEIENIEFVHQFQNLIHALTGKELIKK